MAVVQTSYKGNQTMNKDSPTSLLAYPLKKNLSLTVSTSAKASLARVNALFHRSKSETARTMCLGSEVAIGKRTLFRAFRYLCLFLKQITFPLNSWFGPLV